MLRCTENGFSLTDGVAKAGSDRWGGLGRLCKTAGMQRVPLVIHHSLTHPLILAPHIHTDVILRLISNLAILTQRTSCSTPSYICLYEYMIYTELKRIASFDEHFESV